MHSGHPALPSPTLSSATGGNMASNASIVSSKHEPRPKRTIKPVTPYKAGEAGPSKPRSSAEKRKSTTFTTARSYPEAWAPPPPTSTFNVPTTEEGDLQRSQRRSKVEAISKIDRAGTPAQHTSLNGHNGPQATSFLPPTAQSIPAGPSILRNPLHRTPTVNPVFDISTVRTDAPRYPPSTSKTRLFGLEDCPTFYPSADDFQDPMEYITSIGPQAKPYGMCKIVPPEGWRMPFALPTETFKFKTRLQRINSLEAASRAKVNFLEQLTMFHNQQGDASVTIPIIDRKPLDVWKLRREVHKSGGVYEMNRVNGWGPLTELLGYEKVYEPHVKAAYMKIIQPFDEFAVRAKNSRYSGSPLTPSPAHGESNGAGSHSKPPAFMDKTPTSPTHGKSRMTGMRSTRRNPLSDMASLQVPLTTGDILPTNLSGLLSAQSDPTSDIASKLKVPGFASLDGSDSELSDEEVKSSISGSPAASIGSHLPEYQKGDVCEICRLGHAGDKILLCDGCDRGYHIYCLDPPLSAVPKNEEWFCIACLLGQGDDFGFEEGDEHSIPTFQARDAAFASAWWNKHRPEHPESEIPPMARTFGKVAVTEDDVEREFWRLTESTTDTVEVEYGADIHSTTHSSASPAKEVFPLNPYSDDPWNLNNMPILKESVLRYIKSDISGMTVPWIYLGMLFSAFCWHNEDHYTYSVNYMHWGETKTWYGIPGSDADKFEAAIKSEAPELFEQQPALLYQLVTMMNPGRLSQAGVKVVACDQRPNEFVVTWPKAYHCGFNHGINLNEAVNFALPDWLPMGRDCVLRYKEHAKPPVFSHNELLITITLFSDTIKTALWLKDSLAEMSVHEADSRERLRQSMPQLTGVLVEEDCPEEQYQCCICKGFCYLSQVTCTCTKLVACIDHAAQLCGCDKSKYTLRKRYSEKQLGEIAAAVERRAGIPAVWRGRFDNLLETPRPALRTMRALLAEGEKISHPLPEIDDLREVVSRGNAWVERATTLLTRKSTGRRKKGKHDEEDDVERNPDAYAALLDESANLAFDTPEIASLHGIMTSIQSLKDEVKLILSTPESDLDVAQCRNALILGSSMNIDLPELSSLNKVINRLDWFTKVEEEVDDKTLSQTDVVALLQDAVEFEVPDDHPSVVELRARKDKGEKWKAACEKCLNSDKITLEDLSNLIEGQELTPTDLETMRQLETMRKTALSWQATAVTLLEGNGLASAAQRLMRQHTSATGPLRHIHIPELVEVEGELDYHGHWLMLVAWKLHCDERHLSRELAAMEMAVMNCLRSDDDIPSPDTICYCRSPPGDAKFIVPCADCLGQYHAKCAGVSAKHVDKPYICESCAHSFMPGHRPGLHTVAEVFKSTSRGFIFPPAELAGLKNIIDCCLRYLPQLLQLADPYDETERTSGSTEQLLHCIRKIYPLPLILDSVDVQTGKRVIIEPWLRQRLAEVRAADEKAKEVEGAKVAAATKQVASAVPAFVTGSKRGKRPRIVLYESHPGKRQCICKTPPLDALLELECTKCSQLYHTSCMKVPLEEDHEDKGWRCPCCSVKMGRPYRKDIGVAVRMDDRIAAHEGTYLDYRTCMTLYGSGPVLIKSPSLAGFKDMLILHCTAYIPGIDPDHGGDEDHDDNAARKKQRVDTSDMATTTTNGVTPVSTGIITPSPATAHGTSNSTTPNGQAALFSTPAGPVQAQAQVQAQVQVQVQAQGAPHPLQTPASTAPSPHSLPSVFSAAPRQAWPATQSPTTPQYPYLHAQSPNYQDQQAFPSVIPGNNVFKLPPYLPEHSM